MSRLNSILGPLKKTCETLNRAVAGCARFGDGGWAGDPADYVPPPLEPWQKAKQQGPPEAPPALARAVAPAGAVAPRVVAGGDGPSGTQVSEHSAAFMEGEGGGRTTRLHLHKRPSCSIPISVRWVFAQTTGPERDCVLRVS